MSSSEKASNSPVDKEDEKFCVPVIIWKIMGAFIVLFGIIVFIVWVSLRPSKPRFILEDASIYSFNITAPYRLSSNLQITLAAENPNSKISIYYDTIDAYATYRSQQITFPISLPSAFVGHKDQTMWTPVLIGDSVPIEPFYGDAFVQDQMAGICLIHFEVRGKIRFKVGSFISSSYKLAVNCPAYASFGKTDNNKAAILVGALIKFRLLSSCNVDLNLN